MPNLDESTTVTVGQLIRAAGTVLTRPPGSELADEETGLVAALIAEAAGLDPGDDLAVIALMSAIGHARGGHVAREHQAVPLPGSIHDREDRPVRDGADPDRYPVTGVCGTCHASIYVADVTADWVHLAVMAKAIAGQLGAQLAGDQACPAGLTAPQLARLTGQPPSAVWTVLAEMRDAGLAELVEVPGLSGRWFPLTGGNPGLRETIAFWLRGVSGRGWTARQIADQTGKPEGEVTRELDAMVRAGLGRWTPGARTRWFALTGGNPCPPTG